MNFLNIALLGGAAAFVAPLLIHLLNRSKFQSVDWGAMHLLESALQVNTRQFQWEALLLLLIRCLIPMLLAFCLARPVLTSLIVPGSQGEKSVSLLIDQSLSMNTIGSDGQSFFQRAVDEATLLAQGHRSTETGLWMAGVKSQDVIGGSTFDPARVQRELVNWQAVSGGIDVYTAILAGAEQLARMKNPSKHLIFLSDFQTADWDKLSDSQLSALHAQLADSDPPIQLTLLKVSDDLQTRSNLSARFAEPSEFRVVLDEAYIVAVDIENHSAVSSSDTRAVLWIDGQQLSSRSVAAPGNAVERLLFACQFTQPGWHWIAVQVVDSQGLQQDNWAYQVVEVGRPIRVLIVAQSSSPEFDHASDFVRLALAPFDVRHSKSNRFQVAVADASQLDSLSIRTSYDAIIMAGAASLSDKGSKSLVEFVREGGGLVVLPDDDWDVAWLNQRLLDQDPLLPMRIGERVERESAIGLLRGSLPFPGLHVLNGEEADGLSELSFRSWHRLIPASVDNARNQLQGEDLTQSEPLVILQLASGDPCLVSRSFGKGLVLQCAASCSDPWSNMAIRPVFVPLMQQLVASVARLTQSPNIQAGVSTRLRLTAAAAPIEATLQATAVRKSNPQGDAASEIRIPLSVEGELASFHQTSAIGLYEIESPVDEPNDQVVVTPPMVAVSASPRESTTRLLSDQQLGEIATKLGASAAHSAKEFTQNAKLRQEGREIWRWLLIGLVSLLFLEILFVRGITRGANG